MSAIAAVVVARSLREALGGGRHAVHTRGRVLAVVLVALRAHPRAELLGHRLGELGRQRGVLDRGVERQRVYQHEPAHELGRGERDHHRQVAAEAVADERHVREALLAEQRDDLVLHGREEAALEADRLAAGEARQIEQQAAVRRDERLAGLGEHFTRAVQTRNEDQRRTSALVGDAERGLGSARDLAESREHDQRRRGSHGSLARGTEDTNRHGLLLECGVPT
jgi:hypothetical protein